MRVLGIDLFVVRSDVDLEVAVSLPLRFQDLYSTHLLLEYGISEHVSQQSLTYVSVSFEPAHEIFEEDWEVADEHKKGPHS